MKTIIAVLLVLVLALCAQTAMSQATATTTVRIDTSATNGKALVTQNQLATAIARAIAGLGFTTIPADSAWYLARNGKFYPTVEFQSRPGYFLVDSAGVLVARGFFQGSASDTVVTMAVLRSFFGSSGQGGLPAGVEVDTLKILLMR